MGIREKLATSMVNTARSVGRSLGCELVAVTSEHSIELYMEQPDKERRAWDSDLYKRGQLYYKGYANPIKPVVHRYKDLETPDQISIERGEPDFDYSPEDEEDNHPLDDDHPLATDGGEQVEQESAHIQMISSSRYREYMRQDLISQILTPREQWRLIFIAVLFVGALLLVNIMLTLSQTGML